MIEKLVDKGYTPLNKNQETADYLRNADFRKATPKSTTQRSIDYDCDDGNTDNCDSVCNQ